MKNCLILIFLVLSSLTHAEYFDWPETQSQSSLLKQVFKNPDKVTSNCQLRNEDLRLWLKSAKFLLEIVDYPAGGKNSCAFYDWMSKKGNSEVVFRVDSKGTLETIKAVEIREYLWDLNKKKIVSKENINTSVPQILENIGNQFLGIDRGLSSWDPERQVNPYLYWGAMLRNYFVYILDDYSMPFSFGKEKQELKVFALNSQAKEKIKKLYIFLKLSIGLKAQVFILSFLEPLLPGKTLIEEIKKCALKLTKAMRNHTSGAQYLNHF